MNRAERPLLAAPAPARAHGLPAARLCTRCDPAQFTFETTQTLPPPDEPFGQARAVDAVALALDIGRDRKSVV